MNRRLFFGTLLGGAAVAADPERLLWVPGRKLISIPRPRIYTVADVIAEANRNLGITEPYTSGSQIAAAYREMNRIIDRWSAESWARTYQKVYGV